MNFKTVIGLEIHVQLMTRTKAFCSCKNDTTEAEPNKNICPVCIGHPGTLPVLNREMVNMGIKTALALGCEINKISGFDRKNYFYPDMPKGYQITQFYLPIAEHGKLKIINKKRKKYVQIKRMHLEEDSGKMIHGENDTLIDYNRSGIPLIEIVTEPVINSSEEAVMFLEELKNLLKYIQVCDGNLENGSMRCDVNISVMDVKNGISTNRVEIKNLNSFKNVQKALSYEEKVLTQRLLSGNSEPTLTKSWDERKKITDVMRKKELTSDYRYFPEPDLPLLKIEDDEIRKIQADIPELPSEKLERLMDKYYLKYEEARILTASSDIASFFEETVCGSDSKEVIKWILRDVKKYLNEKKKQIYETRLSPQKLAGLINHIKSGKISNSIAKEILIELFETEKKLKDIIEEEDFLQQNDPEMLKGYLEEIIKDNFEQYEAYQLGKTELFNFFTGKMMSVTKGRSRPELIIKILRERLG